GGAVVGKIRRARARQGRVRLEQLNYLTADLRRRRSRLQAGGAQRVEQKTRDRHRPDAARHRRNRAGDLAGFGKIDITDDAGFAPALTRLMPISITVAPDLIQSPRMYSARAMATQRMSVRRHSAGRSRLRVCAMVTVA